MLRLLPLACVLVLGCGRVFFRPGDSGGAGPDSDAPDAAELPDARVNESIDAHVIESIDAHVVALPDAHVEESIDARLAVADAIETVPDDVSLTDSPAPVDAATSGRCMDPRAELTAQGCVIPSASPCSPFSPCPSAYSCTTTSSGDRCRCDDQAVCGPRCSASVLCNDSRFPVCHRGQCYAPRGCLGSTSAAYLCGPTQNCDTRHACVARGVGAPGARCGSASECMTNSCAGGQCIDACSANADCPIACVESFSDPASCASAAPCGSCAGPEQRCINALGMPQCVESCGTTSDCSTGTCRIRNGSSLEPYCQPTPGACNADELQIDTDDGRRQACVRRVSCFVAADCGVGETCIPAAFGGLSNPVTLCGRVL